MTTLFTRILDGELPGRFVYADEVCAAFLTIAPLQPGHTLVVPRAEVDHWLDLDPETVAHLMKVAQQVGKAQQAAFSPARVGMIIAGMEVPHTHLLVPAPGDLARHVRNELFGIAPRPVCGDGGIGTDELHGIPHARADHGVSDASLDDAAERLRAALVGLDDQR